MSKLLYGGSGQRQWPGAIEAALAGLAMAGDFTGAKVILFTNAIAYPVKSKVYADLTQPTYTGYAISGAITWGAAFLDLNGNVVFTGQKIQFLVTADTPGAPTIKGAAIVDGAGTKLLAVDIFLDADGNPAPVTMETNGDALDYVPAFSFVNRTNE